MSKTAKEAAFDFLRESQVETTTQQRDLLISAFAQFQSSPKWVDELYLLQKSINAADPFGYDVLIKDLAKQIASIISKAETPGNVSPQAAVVAEEKFFTTDEVWRMYSEDPAYGHKSYKEFAEENGWVMVRLKAAPTPTDEQVQEVKEEPLFYLSELIRTVSRVANKFPDALMEHDLDRLTQAQGVLKKHSKTDPTKILSNQNKIQ